MAHPYIDDVRKSHSARLKEMVGKPGEHVSEKAERLAAQDDSASTRGIPHLAEEHFVGAPARQISDFGKVRK